MKVALLTALLIPLGGCVVMTKRNFIEFQAANQSLGRLQGLSDCNEKIFRYADRTESAPDVLKFGEELQ
jgi:hypothetical protein